MNEVSGIKEKIFKLLIGNLPKSDRGIEMIKVLIADDEYIMRQGLKYIINWEDEGYEIVGEASNGQEAFALTQELCPHIVICDIVMPVLDGVDFSQLIHENYPNIQLIILSGYDKFEYVKNTLMNGAVDYILKPTLTPDGMRSTLKKASERIPGYCLDEKDKGNSLGRSIERYLIGQDQELPAERLSQQFQYGCYQLYAVNIKKENTARVRNLQAVSITKVLYQKIERELQEFKNVHYLQMMLREEVACILLNYDESSSVKVMMQLKQLNDKLLDICSSLLGVCSRRFVSYRQLYDIYQRDISENVDKAFYYPNMKLLMAEDLEKDSKTAKKERFDFAAYNHMLNCKQYENAAELLMDYGSRCIKAKADVYGLKNQMKNMIYHFMEYLELPDSDMEEKRYEFFSRLNQTAYSVEFTEAVRDILGQLVALSGVGKEPNADRMERLLYYIAENYREDLKLSDLSEAFNMNYYYLSAYFNQEMKESFSDYLNRIRIRQACSLLEETNMPISEVGSEVGYSDHSYFCRVFKKITGRTPSEWKKLQQR